MGRDLRARQLPLPAALAWTSLLVAMAVVGERWLSAVIQ